MGLDSNLLKGSSRLRKARAFSLVLTINKIATPPLCTFKSPFQETSSQPSRLKEDQIISKKGPQINPWGHLRNQIQSHLFPIGPLTWWELWMCEYVCPMGTKGGSPCMHQAVSKAGFTRARHLHIFWVGSNLGRWEPGTLPCTLQSWL